MNIDKAIEILTTWKKENCPPPLADELNALHLGIEALKRIRRQRTLFLPGEIVLLSGETIEQ